MDKNPLRLLLTSRILRSFAMSFIFLVIPLYLKHLGYTATQIGLIYVPFILSAIFLPIVLGNIGDRFGYVKTLIMTDSLMVVSLFLLSISNSILLIIIAGLIGGYNISNGSLRGAFSPGQTALIANIYKKNNRIRILGYITMAAGLASVFGPALLLLSNVSTNIYIPLLRVGMIVMIISMIPLPFIKENKHQAKKAKVFSVNTFRFLWKILTINAVNGFASGIFMPLLPLWLLLRYNLSPSSISIAFIIINIWAAFGAIFSSRLAKKIGTINTASVTRSFSGILLLISAFSPLLWIFVVLYSIRSFINGFGAPTRGVIVVNNVDNSDMGTASGVAGSVTRASALSTGLSGYLMDIDIFSPLIIGGVLQITSGLMYLLFFRNKIKD
ncbi:MFS transporter [Candidatus Parvarchaeota archaeon]|nr:MFS transporter [Candidatus Acidifodinimicrobium mancum]